MELRPYQVEPVKKGVDYFKSKNPKPSLIIAPTAAGKSIIIAKIAEELNEKILAIQPSIELLNQNVAKFRELGGRCSIYSASANSRRIGEVTYATIGSIKNIGKTFKDYGFTKLIIDEAHLYPRESDSMLGKFIQDAGITHVLGLTATPLKLQTNLDIYRNTFSKLVMLTSRSGKGNFYKEIIHCIQIQEMTALKFWSKLEYELYQIDSSGLVYNSTKAEFTEASINKMYELNNTNDRIKFKITELQGRKSILVFVPSVSAAKRLATEVPGSACVYGDMPADERVRVISDFKTGRIKIVFNFGVLTTGFDHPELDCIILGRVTSSLSLYYQIIGRGSRIHPNKKDCLIVDFGGLVSRFGKVENFYYVQEKGTWKLYGENGILLTGIPITEIGKHTHATEAQEKPVLMTFGVWKGQEVKNVPVEYRNWALGSVNWTEYNKPIRKEMERLRNLENNATSLHSF